jgi:hypothetical protein
MRGSKVLQNSGILPQDYTVSTRRPQLEQTCVSTAAPNCSVETRGKEVYMERQGGGSVVGQGGMDRRTEGHTWLLHHLLQIGYIIKWLTFSCFMDLQSSILTKLLIFYAMLIM